MPYLLLRGLSHSATACALLLLTACAEAPAQPLAATPITATAAPASPIASAVLSPTPLLSFDEWRTLLRSDAIAAGIDADLFDRTFSGITLDPRVVTSDSSQ
ncbi:MAG: lytic murein transglycosylase, partial [Pseudomonas sp.]|nr:lytic murein transglycosylase [Pseudomonas sp.]